jgi:hypothetical protein
VFVVPQEIASHANFLRLVCSRLVALILKPEKSSKRLNPHVVAVDSPLRPWRNLTNERPLCLYPRHGSGLVSDGLLTTRVRRVAFREAHLILVLPSRFRPNTTRNAPVTESITLLDMPRLPARITLAQARSAPPVTPSLGGELQCVFEKRTNCSQRVLTLGVFSTRPPPATLMVTFGLRAEPWEVVVVFSFLLGCWRIVGMPYDRRNTLRFRGWSKQKFEDSHQPINSLVYRYLQYSLTTLFLLAQRLLPQSAR